MNSTVEVCFVCLGNICRSPLAEGVFRHKAEEIGLEYEFDSAGTGGWHAGEEPDQRMQETALKYGIDISDLRARQFSDEDFDQFDKIFVMDESNQSNVLAQAKSSDDEAKVELLLNTLHPGEDMVVPDPYFGGQRGFDHVYELLNDTADRFFEQSK